MMTAHSKADAHGHAPHAHVGVGTHDHDHTHTGAHDHDHTGPHRHAPADLNTHGYEHAHAAGLHRHGPFGLPHAHVPSEGQEVTLRGLLTLGISGGLLPCPSALVVLLSAIALHRVGFGLLLIVAFSLGLAGVLTGIGLLLAYARHLTDRLPLHSRAVRLLPVVSACAVALMGAAVTVQSLLSGRGIMG